MKPNSQTPTAGTNRTIYA